MNIGLPTRKQAIFNTLPISYQWKKVLQMFFSGGPHYLVQTLLLHQKKATVPDRLVNSYYVFQ